ncbi:MAG: error-prone DNA polymerase [Gemmatimonadales bacterium]|nr:error-prone DNA polymerase [Gemmatimonadales bacterium]
MFVELRAHSAFSFGDGGVSPEALARHAKALGHTALGLTDRADLGGIARFAVTCREQGIRPIVGAELVVDGRPLALLVRSALGFRNLAALITASRVGNLRRWTRRTATRGRPRLTWDDVAAHHEGLHLLTGPTSGALATALRERRRSDADLLLARYRSTFDDRLAIEVQHHHAGRDEEALAGALVALARQRGIPWFVTQNPRYIDPGTRLVHEILTALRHQTTVPLATDGGLLHPNGEWVLRSPEEMALRWRGAEAGLETTARIAEACEFNLRWVRPPLPRFKVPEGQDDDSFIRQLAFEGGRERWGELDARQTRQLDHELTVIARLGYSGFFLVMWDAVRFARDRGILAQGRGSAANSAVAYCLGITAVDPVRHGLLFERFLSEARVDGMTEAPDIDVDFEHDRREEVLDYVYRRYQRSHSALTGVTQIYSASTAIQDTMRAFGFPAQLAFALSKRMRNAGSRHGVDLLTEGLAAAHGFDLADPRAPAILEAMAAFDDLPRLRSTHPGGFVLSAEPLGSFLPIESTSMGRTIIQFDKDDLDTLGIPKFDFLGLGGLALVRRAFDAIEARTGRELSMYRLPDDDRATYEMISRGDTIGTFQIESRAQIASILHTKPERLYDIVVQVALIRPGPIQANFVHPYTRRRRGEEKVTYLHPALEPLLERTQGIPIFQEQAMAIAMTLAGYTAAEADLLRRTMGHQRKKVRLLTALAELRDRLIGKGVSEPIATRIEEDLMSFANYGFPESHAWSFALIAFATAYLKAHYPTEFLMALLNAQPMGFYPIATLIHDARRHGVVVTGPCLARGASDCTVEERLPDGNDRAGSEPERDGTRWRTIVPRTRTASTMPPPASLFARRPPAGADDRPVRLRLGWRFIRGIGDQALEALTRVRALAPFRDIADVVHRARLGRSDAIALARAGSFARWEPDRRKAAWEALRHVGDVLPLAPSAPVDHAPRKLARTEGIFLDYFAMGTSLAGHPVEHLRRRLSAAGAIDSRALATIRHGEEVLVGGLVVTRQRPESANGVLFILMEDEFGFLNAIVRREVEVAFREVARRAPFLLILGRIQRDGPVVQIIAEKLKPLKPRAALAFRSRDFR